MSEYIQKNDYLGIIQESTIDQITSQQPALLDEVEAMALDEVRPYLPNVIIEKSANKALKMRIIDIALYHLHSRLPLKEIPQHRIDRYNQAIDWLNKILDGDITLTDLTYIDANNDGIPDVPPEGIRFGSEKKQKFIS